MTKPHPPRDDAPSPEQTQTQIDVPVPNRSVVGSVVSAIAETHPHLVDDLMRFEKDVRHEATLREEARYDSKLRTQQSLIDQFQLLVTAQENATKQQLQQSEAAFAAGLAQAEGKMEQAFKRYQEQASMQSSAFAKHTESIRGAEEARTAGVGKHLSLVGEQGEQVARMLGEHKETIEKLRASRDKFSKDLGDLQSRANKDTRDNAKALRDLMTRSDASEAAMDKQLATSRGQVENLQAQLEGARAELVEAKAERDRVADHVRRVEETIEATLVPLREEVDNSRQAIKDLRAELRDAHRGLAVLRPPPLSG